MGNRGINSWKLSAFFIFGLMLFAVVFSNIALTAENDGAGMVSVTWISQTADVGTTIPTLTFAAGQTILNAGSTRNALRFEYTAFIPGVAATGVNAIPIDMAGGEVRIAIPAGWKVPDKLTVIDNAGTGGTTLYDSVTAAATDDHKANVTFTADKHIAVKLGDGWAARNRATAAEIGRVLQITFYNVQTGIPSSLASIDNGGDGTANNADDVYAYKYPFNTSSKAMGGTHIRIGTQPMVNVGNIIGDKTGAAYAGRDTLNRKVTITPGEVFQGETGHRFSISFTAPGPMYYHSLTIAIPSEVAPAATITAGDLRMSQRGVSQRSCY